MSEELHPSLELLIRETAHPCPLPRHMGVGAMRPIDGPESPDVGECPPEWYAALTKRLLLMEALLTARGDDERERLTSDLDDAMARVVMGTRLVIAARLFPGGHVAEYVGLAPVLV